MRILILCNHLNPGGISRYVINLARGLTERGHSVWVAGTTGSWVGELLSCHVNFLEIPLNTKSIVSIKIALSFFILRKLVRKEKIEVVHCNTRVTQMLGFLLARLCCRAYVSAFHGFYKVSLLRRKIRLSGAKSIAVSKAVAEHLKHDFNISASNIKVIYNGIDVHKNYPRIERQTHGFTNEDVIIGILGRISEEKGQLLAAEAMSHLQSKYRELRFVVSGSGKLEEDLRTFFKTHDLEATCKILNLPSAEFLPLLDILLVPSRKEGFGFSIVEAFVAQVPVVGFATGGIQELIRHKENGILFYEYTAAALEEAIQLLLEDRMLRDRIVEQAKKDSMRYSIERMASTTEDVYKEVLL